MERLIDERMGVKGVFCKDKKGFCDYGFEYCRKCQFAKGNGVIDGNIAHDVLATLFGLEYDLDRLRELVQGDRDGRCVVFPCKNWLELVFGGQEVFYGIDTDYAENPIREISVDSSSRCTWYDGWKTVLLKGYDENGFDWEFSPEDIDKTVFLTREQAEAALNKMKEAESK